MRGYSGLLVTVPRVPDSRPCDLLGLSMNGTHDAGDISHEELNFSDNEGDDAPDGGLGDYSARFEELMSDGEDEDGHAGEEDEDEEAGFVYSGVDADPTGGYREQLREVLGQDHEEDELDEEQEVERSLVHEVEANEKYAATIEDEAGVSRPTTRDAVLANSCPRLIVSACPDIAPSHPSTSVPQDPCASVFAV